MDRYRGKQGLAAALAMAAITVAVGGLTAPSSGAAVTVTRVGGADRFATAAAVSAQAFLPDALVAYVATGATFPDALAAGPAAARGKGPVLLTRRDSLPGSTRAELDRLDPQRIVVVGGPDAISQSVLDQLQQYTDGTVTRASGADRYETAAAVSAAAFLAPVHTLLVATGRDYSDALAAGPIAANAPSGDGPLLLTDRGALPAATKAELARLTPQKVIVVGGTDSVSDAVVAELDAYSVDPVERRFGSDRFRTSVDLSMSAFASADKVYLATGVDFPDALASSAPAGIAHGPVLFTRQGCIPPEVNDEITRLNPSSLIIVGGETAVSNAVMNRTTCPVLVVD